MWRVNRCVPVLALAVAFGAQRMVAAQSIAVVPQITVHELGEGERPLIDGHVDEMSWSTTESFSGFVQQEPNDGEPATERTEIRFLLDRQNLYIGVICFDDAPVNILVC